MAVTDVLTAIIEDRPHRKGMASDGALQVLRPMAESSVLDSYVVSTLRLYYDEVNSVRIAARAVASKEYQEFGQQTG